MRKKAISIWSSFILCTLLIGLFTFEAGTAHATTANTPYKTTMGTVTNMTWGGGDARPGFATANGYLYSVWGRGNAFKMRKATTYTGLATATENTVTGMDAADWVVGLYYDNATSTFYVTAHVEYDYFLGSVGAHHYRKIKMYKSTDGLATVTKVGDIITSDNSDIHGYVDYTGNYYDFGAGDHNFYVDEAGGYAYIFYAHAWADLRSQAFADGMFKSERVARAPISQLGDPNAWKNFYLGAWNEPGRGGNASDLADGTNGYVFYSSVIGKYLMVYNNTIASATSLTLQDWTPLYTNPDLTWFYYASALDMDTYSPYIIGSNAIYLELTRRRSAPLTVTNTVTNRTVIEPTYPAESVPDNNYGWDWNFTGTPAPKPLTYIISYQWPYQTHTAGIGFYSDYTVPYSVNYGFGMRMTSTAVGDYVQLNVNVPTAGTYKLYSYNATGPGAGDFQLAIDGVNQGSSVSLFEAAPAHPQNGLGYKKTDMGTVTFATAGNHTFKYTVTGKNAASTGYQLYFDVIKLVNTTTTPPPPATFSDNFESGTASGWTTTAGTWAVVTDGSKVYQQSNSATADTHALNGNTAWTNYTVNAKVKVDAFDAGGYAGVGIDARYQDANNNYSFQYYKLTGELKIQKKVAGVFTTLATKNYAFSTGTWYNMKAVLNGGNLEFWVNGNLELSATDASFSSGKIGLNAHRANAKFDDVTVQ
ncbi:hypothetical protein A8709_27930 [Paenibacillus pectinilyticus]|uniref:CBM6 domain-containing protein n=1 Tax=Paenibacillus pectinilyticus TaxID=512399 RepID=A0A1C0ZUC9_9BACL|nr:family 16 glycoside hydrolase [Paenibacillus pectinilyticus]OCT11706.1 hypothetical protein A8709_27930 [Paenibacillus pectinilyticus]